jgi:uncharacterized membrane protein
LQNYFLPTLISQISHYNEIMVNILTAEGKVASFLSKFQRHRHRIEAGDVSMGLEFTVLREATKQILIC